MKPVFSRLLGSTLGAAVASGDGPWRAKTVWVAVLITALGFGLWVRDAATNDGNTPATASGIAVSTDGTAKPATWDFSRPLPGYAQVSGSYIGGFVLGWLFRRFIRMALALAAGLVLLLGIGKYAGWDAPKTEVWMNPDCVLLTCRMFWKCLLSTSSMAWQNPQMKNRLATMRNANNRA